MRITTVLAAPKYIVDEDVPFVWCDEDYPIIEAGDDITYFADDINYEYY